MFWACLNLGKPLSRIVFSPRPYISTGYPIHCFVFRRQLLPPAFEFFYPLDDWHLEHQPLESIELESSLQEVHTPRWMFSLQGMQKVSYIDIGLKCVWQPWHSLSLRKFIGLLAQLGHTFCFLWITSPQPHLFRLPQSLFCALAAEFIIWQLKQVSSPSKCVTRLHCIHTPVAYCGSGLKSLP